VDVLDVRDLHLFYGHVHALKGISLTVQDGETVVLIGANGAGKSTTLRAISALLPIQQGEVRIGGETTAGWAPHHFVQRGVIHVPEGRQIFPQMSVYENLILGAYFCKDSGEVRRRWEHVFQLFPILAQRQRQFAGTLSGGEQQMLAIGRGLMAEPKLLMLDEPSLGLAPTIVDLIFEVLVKLNREGMTLLLVEQNATLALSIADRGYVLETGQIVGQGTANALLEDEGVQRAYLGY
jgi:branched-chain amino acid transport system ATP-binding protein